MSSLQGLFGPPDVEKLKAKGKVKAWIKALGYKKDAKVHRPLPRAGNQDYRGVEMNKRKLWKLMAALGLAVTSLLLLFLLLGQITVGAAPGEHVTITDTRSPSADFTASGTATSEATGLGMPDLELITDTVLNVDLCVCSGVWVSETVDSAGDVGTHTSLALAPTLPYTPHISYRHAITAYSETLKYAWLSGTAWLSETVDSGGRHTSLALEPTYPYTPCISHHDLWGWVLRYARRDGITWTKRIVEDWRSGLIGISLALEPTYPYTPHISYFLPFGFDDLRHAYLSGTVMSGTWVITTVDSYGGVGGYSSLALEPTRPYTPHISYLYWGNYDLKHAWLSGTTWFSETVDSAGDVGWYTSLALDSGGNPYISYYDATNRDLKYAWLSGTTWFSETVDSAGDVGLYSSLALDPAGCPHISYYDATNKDLRYAYIPTVPTADFTAWPTTGVKPLTVDFTNTSTCNYTTSRWDFGNGVTSTLPSPTHTYTATGVYTVALMVSGPGGTDTLTRTNYITVTPGCIPLTDVAFTYVPAQPVIHSPVTFTAIITPSDATTPITYTWDFGDGVTTTVTTASVQHTYAVSGTQTVSVTAYNRCTPAGVTSTLINIEIAPIRVYLPLILRNY